MDEEKMKYFHVWFQTKSRKYMLVDFIDDRIHELFRQISKEKNIKLLASGTLLDHMHLLIGLENGQDLPWAVKMLKGISSRRIFQETSLLKQQLKTNNFWARRYAAKEIPAEKLPVIVEYILNQKRDLCVV